MSADAPKDTVFAATADGWLEENICHSQTPLRFSSWTATPATSARNLKDRRSVVSAVEIGFYGTAETSVASNVALKGEEWIREDRNLPTGQSAIFRRMVLSDPTETVQNAQQQL